MADLYFADEGALRRYKAKKIASAIILYTFVTLFALFMLLPFVFMLVGSLTDAESFDEFTKTANFELIGFNKWSFSNFEAIFSGQIVNRITGATEARPSFAQYYLNTLITAVGSTAVTVVTAVLAAFAFARLEFKGKNILFTLLLATMMIPGELMVLTNYKTTKSLDWEYTFSALIFVHGVSVFYIFYLRQTFQQIPNELYLAAKVDGVGDVGYLIKVMVPIAMPTIVTIIILSLMGAWNSYVWPLLVANGGWKYDKSYNMQLVSNGLMSLFNSDIAKGLDAIKIAGSMVVTFPLFVFFLIFRKYIMKGVSRSGIKG
ncbi:MAG: carbohydrate ABC transporter permease [Bacilli bacterium]|nr:carbohydrate ABC transporter permease [Bacilli bacterium]